MDILTLEKLIDEIASQNNLDKGKLILEIHDWLKLKYGIIFLEKERILIDSLKNKIITRLYNFENHMINIKETDRPASYKADQLEKNYINQAEHELEVEGLIQKSGNTISLSEAGMLKYKEFYGELG